MSPESRPTTLVIGDLEATRLTCELLRQDGRATVHLAAPTDRQIAEVLGSPMHSVVVIVHSDVQALRYVLVVEHLQPGIRLVTTVFDRTVAEQLLRVVPNCTVTSPANISAPAIVAAQVFAPYAADMPAHDHVAVMGTWAMPAWRRHGLGRQRREERRGPAVGECAEATAQAAGAAAETG